MLSVLCVMFGRACVFVLVLFVFYLIYLLKKKKKREKKKSLCRVGAGLLSIFVLCEKKSVTF